MTFRPLPVLTGFSVAALGLLVWLGTWQVGRAGEARARIDAAAAAQASPVQPIGLQEALCTPDPIGVLVVPPPPASAAAVRLYAGGPGGGLGWRSLHLVAVPPCNPGDSADTFVIGSGTFVPLTGGTIAAPGRLVLAAPPRPGAMAPANRPDAGEFYTFDAEALALALGAPPGSVRTDIWLADAALGARAGEDAALAPARHLGYAATWYLMAVALLAIYLAFHARAGRFAAAPRDPDHKAP